MQISNAHQAMLYACAVITHAVLEHSTSSCNDRDSDRRLEDVFKTFAKDHQSFAAECDLNFVLRSVRR